MALFVWSDKYSVNIKKMDEQHKKLVDMLNELHDSMKIGKGNDVLGKIFTGLVQYVVVHFDAEERLLSAHAYPGYTDQKTAHDKLTQKVLELQKKISRWCACNHN
jgi:hemerythrin